MVFLVDDSLNAVALENSTGMSHLSAYASRDHITLNKSEEIPDSLLNVVDKRAGY